MRIDGILSRLRMLLWRCTGYARGVDRSAYIHYTVDVFHAGPRQIAIERGVIISKHTWLNVPPEADPHSEILRIGAGTGIGRNNVISAKNRIEIGPECVTAPQVLIMDHGHEFRDVDRPILRQGTSPGGRIVIEPGVWIGFGAAVVCNRGVLRIGRNSVIGANAVVTSDVPPCTVVVGAPARPVRTYDEQRQIWLPIARSQSRSAADASESCGT